ncbi:hypothetical protein HanPSC8_Chr11g0498451 [Helianthus annuus]|nr:hypothetical protein HanPSC8_Chr11g0498451 [Helianthus annuus]
MIRIQNINCSSFIHFELGSLIPKVDSLETEVGNERALSGKMRDRCWVLEGELESLNMKVDSLETDVEKERALSKKMGAKCRELGELESLNLKVDYLETETKRSALYQEDGKQVSGIRTLIGILGFES